MAWLTVFGIPAMAYVMGVTALLFHMNDRPQNPVLLVGAGLLTAGIYIFHRTSITFVEPMQERHRIALKHRMILRVLAFLLGVLATAIFALHHPMATLLVFGALAGVIAYGRKTITRPLRTVLYLKPIAVGTAIACFAWTLNDFENGIMSVIAFVLFCTADALCCDLEDCTFDSATGCTTMATRLGVHRTWIVAGLLYICAAFLLQATVGWLFLVSFALPIALRSNKREVIDLRPALVLLLLWVL